MKRASMPVTDKDVDTLWRTIWGEARGETLGGKIAVAHVILNRVRLQSWMGKTIRGVCRKPWQFSCWNRNDPNREKMLKAKPSDALECLFAATGALSGHLTDPTRGATHYYAFRAIQPPKWASKLKKTAQIGGHIFMKK